MPLSNLHNAGSGRQETEIQRVDSPSQSPRDVRRNAWAAVAVVSALTLVLYLLGLGIPLIGANLVALFAVVFVQVPQYLLPKDGPGAEHYGFTSQGALRGAAIGLGLGLVVLMGYLPGNHVWSTQVLGQSLHIEDAYARPADRLHGEPPPSQAVSYFHYFNVQYVRWTPTEGPWRITVSTDGTLYTPDHQRLGETYSWSGASPRPVQARFRTVDASFVEVEAVEAGVHVAQDDFAMGPTLSDVRAGTWQDGGLRLKLTRWWLPLAVLLQVVFIAFPEEFFYRGFLQKRLDEANGRRVWLRLGPIELSRSNVVVSVVFALGHFVLGLDPMRLAVFFPSLLFGWLRDRTGGIAASIVFHACCNLMVQVVAVHYW